ncbi:hypothetical protein GLYMA_01G083400v4 [Glycine max]|uniref:Uncharacterized protein n=2 Tax=Glycine subgen. Soja TaxID=1462606 RepID=A0A0R0LD08_SOYBN|nr:hypothetical protein JHK85_000961 [Glycine max]KRH75400.1 hypothetical protein GLYMA_01G083400v4 [Glycine max]KRH75401.1 hypothetical protein GLYMA_01G083400v4 [Glycine max]KRH75402.1 hypothetical protein GLYMA_01G083400v4 [Glycine max]RZC29044.1 hypothetical protein D0Y65_000855 [Glycine soja]
MTSHPAPAQTTNVDDTTSMCAFGFCFFFSFFCCLTPVFDVCNFFFIFLFDTLIFFYTHFYFIFLFDTMFFFCLVLF